MHKFCRRHSSIAPCLLHASPSPVAMPMPSIPVQAVAAAAAAVTLSLPDDHNRARSFTTG